jgi:hypothetical protein
MVATKAIAGGGAGRSPRIILDEFADCDEEALSEIVVVMVFILEVLN